jgi:manganese/zinc/iron transport system permease protein
MIAFWIILTGTLVAVSAGLLGCFLVLRKMSMLGDAISHSVLPGIVIAVLLSGSRDPFTMILGAGVLGLLTTFLIEYFQKKAKLQSDSAIGVTFTFLFAVGIILISLFAGFIDIDQDCVLYGEIAYVPIDTWILSNGVNMGPRAVYILGTLLVLVIAFILSFYKQLSLTSFDPAFASAMGISTVFWHYALMSFISITTVVSFDSVGAILIINFLIGPPSIAYLLTGDLKRMLLYTIVIGIVISVFGYLLAAYFDVSVAGSMASITGLVFALSYFYTKKKAELSKRSHAKLVLSEELNANE